MLVELIKRLDGLGLTDVLATSGGLLGQVGEVLAAEAEDRHHARLERDQLVAKVAAGELTLDRATARVAELANWLAARDDQPTPARAFAGRVVDELRRRAKQTARDEGLNVHSRLSGLADVAVKRAVAAGGTLVDVRAVVVALKPPRRRDTVQTTPVQQDTPKSTSVPLPRVDLASIERDPRRMGLWAQASAALADLANIHEAAELLHSVVGGSSTLFGADVDSDQRYRIVRDLAEPLHLAVFDALGWKPGLHLSLQPGERRPPDGAGEAVHRGVRYPVGWAAGLVAPTVGPRTVAGTRPVDHDHCGQTGVNVVSELGQGTDGR